MSVNYNCIKTSVALQLFLGEMHRA